MDPLLQEQLSVTAHIHPDAFLTLPKRRTFVPAVYQQQFLALVSLQENPGPTLGNLGWHQPKPHEENKGTAQAGLSHAMA